MVLAAVADRRGEHRLDDHRRDGDPPAGDLPAGDSRGGHPRDEARLRAVWAEHGRAMLAFATRLTGDRPAAEDLVQEAMLRAWRNSEKLVNGAGSVRSWLLTVLLNLARDRARRRNARPTEVAEVAGLPVATTADHAEAVADRLLVGEALAALSAEHRAVLELLYLQGRSVQDAAAVLGIPAGTVRSRTYYALRAVRAAFDSRHPRVTLVAS
jgi:RNA polymerase sigma-70 factor (ECF subfamily)